MGNVRYKGRVALTTVITLGLGIAGLALSHKIVLTCVMLFLSGASVIAGSPPSIPWCNSLSPTKCAAAS